MKNINDYKITTFERKLYEPRGEYSKSVVDVMPYLLRFIEKNVLNDKKITWNTRQSILALFSDVKIKEDTIECYASPVFKTIKSIRKFSDLNDEQKRYITHKIAVYFSFIREKSKSVILSNRKKSQTKELASYFYNPSFNKALGVVLNYPSDDCIYVVNNTPVISLIGWRYSDLPDTDKEIYNYISTDFNSNKLYVEAIDPTENFYNEYHYFTSPELFFADPNIDEIKKSLSSDNTLYIGDTVRSVWQIEDNEQAELGYQEDYTNNADNPHTIKDLSDQKDSSGPNLEETPNDEKTAPWLIKSLKISLVVFVLALVLLILYVCYIDWLDDFFEEDKNLDRAPYSENVDNSTNSDSSPASFQLGNNSIVDKAESLNTDDKGKDSITGGNFATSSNSFPKVNSSNVDNIPLAEQGSLSSNTEGNNLANSLNQLENNNSNEVRVDDSNNAHQNTNQHSTIINNKGNEQLATDKTPKESKTCVIEGDKLLNCKFGFEDRIKEPVEITLDNIGVSFTLNYSNKARIFIKFDSEPLCSFYAPFEYSNGNVVLPIDNAITKESCGMDISLVKCKSNFTNCTLLLDSGSTIARVHSQGAVSHLGSHSIDTRIYKK